MHSPLLECARLGLQEGLNIRTTGYKPKLQASHTRSDGSALTTAGMCQVGVAGVVEHGHNWKHAQSCAAVGGFLVACGMSIGIHTGGKELQLLYAAWLIGACFGNCGLERLTACTGKDCFQVLLALNVMWQTPGIVQQSYRQQGNAAAVRCLAHRRLFWQLQSGDTLYRQRLHSRLAGSVTIGGFPAVPTFMQAARKCHLSSCMLPGSHEPVSAVAS